MQHFAIVRFLEAYFQEKMIRTKYKFIFLKDSQMQTYNCILLQ